MNRITCRAVWLVLMAAILPFSAGCASGTRQASTSAAPRPSGSHAVPYGRLQIIGGRLCGSDGKPVQLRGMSTAGLQWFSEIINDKAFKALAQDWRANLVRLTLYVGQGGYATHPELIQHLEKGIELAVAHGLYVIVNWAVLAPGNPNDETYRGAQGFFDRISKFRSWPSYSGLSGKETS